MPVLWLIKSRVAVMSNCAVCCVSDFKPSVFGETKLFVTLCCVVVYCNAVLTVPQCPPPYGQELNLLVYKTGKKKRKKEMCGNNSRYF